MILKSSRFQMRGSCYGKIRGCMQIGRITGMAPVAGAVWDQTGFRSSMEGIVQGVSGGVAGIFGLDVIAGAGRP